MKKTILFLTHFQSHQMNRLSGLILSTFILLGCQGKQNLEHVFSNLNYGLPNKDVLVIPYHGCSNCVNKALKYLSSEKNIELPDVIVINFNSQKEVELKLARYKISTESVSFIKEFQPLLKAGISHFYPTYIKLVTETERELIIIDPKSQFLD